MGLLGWLRSFWQRDAVKAEALPHVVVPAPEPPLLVTDKVLQSRGYRNKNPGNIDFNAANKWVGQVGIEPAPRNGGKARFAVFDCHEHGIRALHVLLQSYQRKHGLRTIAGMINRWAPTKENNTSVYISFVAQRVGVAADAPIDVMEYRIARPLVEAIIRKELGGNPYAPSIIDEGLRRAGVVV
jgi:hypothetical protein